MSYIFSYHDSQNKSQSVCAFVASVNQLKTKFFSRATHQTTHQELSDNLCLSLKSALAYYFKINRGYPDKIIIYRDGVSDGELQNVKFQEVNQILEAVKIKEDYKPKLGFVVVKKRGNARFFEEINKGKIENPGCGTVIDNTVTRPDWYDFYLVPQHVSQGTVNPTHFNIIYDSTGLKADHYQKLSFKLCHMYYNWPGAIRVPAVCQYAHKLAFLVGQSLHKEHHISLADKLYYL
jgi:aubergine